MNKIKDNQLAHYIFLLFFNDNTELKLRQLIVKVLFAVVDINGGKNI